MTQINHCETPLGDFVTEELRARGWTEAEIAKVMVMPSRFICDGSEITLETALRVSKAYGVSADFFAYLDAMRHASKGQAG